MDNMFLRTKMQLCDTMAASMTRRGPRKTLLFALLAAANPATCFLFSVCEFLF